MNVATGESAVMEEVATTAEWLKVPVGRLTTGMFVTAIEDNGRVAVANAGQIRHQHTINKLKSSDIEFVWVDVARSSGDCGLKRKPVITQVAKTVPAKPKPTATANRSLRQRRSEQLLGEAKGLIRKVLSETFEGKAIEVAPLEVLADNLIESIMKDGDALKCLSALRDKDAYLLEHSVNVAFLLVTFGKYLELPREMLKQMAVGGILHDIGKVKVENRVLHKPGKLTPEEFEHMKLHQVYAREIMSQTADLSQIAKDVCLMHHEKLDGRGYPHGLREDQIPLHGRMACIVDIYDALTATRCYKEAISPAAAFKILLSLTPFHLDPELVYDFIRCIGVYPVGSLVELSDGRVGIVWEAEDRDALHPVVKCFYSVAQRRYTPVVLVDLKATELHIERGVSPASLDVDPKPFY